MTWSGMPSSSAAAFSSVRCSVVQQVPRPRARAASMKLHTAGSSEPQMAACQATGRLSVRPSMHGMTCTGTSARWSARYCAELMTFLVVVDVVGLVLRAGGPATASGLPYMTAKAAAYHSASWRRLAWSVTTMKCQPWLLPPVGAWVATSMHSRSSSGSTGRLRSRRLRTDRVVERSSSGPSGSSVDMEGDATPAVRRPGPPARGPLPSRSART